MDSMKRSEASNSHHQKKVVLTNQATDSNNRVNLSGSNLNNNTVSNKQQHQSASLNPNQAPGAPDSTQLNPTVVATATDINKDANFEYDDNEWDVGIGDLIIDLDADIEKSSVSNQQQHCAPSPAHTQSLVSLSSVGSTLDTLPSGNTGLRKSLVLNASGGPQKPCNQTEGGPAKANYTSSSTKVIVSTNTSIKGGTISSTSSKHHSSSSSSSSSLLSSGHHHHHHHHHKSNSNSESVSRSASNPSKHSVLLSQLNSNKHSNLTSLNSSGLLGVKHHLSSDYSGSSCSGGLETDSSKSSRSSSTSTMSSTAGSSGSKSATKLAVDHQATLDKGLKMKIKRTKPGTKTSEAKHEIVKAEQNGTGSLTASSTDENNSNSNSSSNSSSKKHSSQSQMQAQQVASPNVSQQQQQQQQQPQGNKRGSSGHRRDKTKEKTTHHNQRDKNEHNVNNSSVNSGATSNNDRGCNCTHDVQVNGIQQPCSNMSCIRNRTSDQSINPLSQRLSNQNNTSTSTSNSIFANSNTGSSLSSTNTPNAPGPPSSRDGSKISSAATGNNTQLPNLQHSTSSSGGSSAGSGGSSSSNNNGSNVCTGSSSSANAALKTQLQSTTPPTSLLSTLSTGTTSSPNVSTATSNQSMLHSNAMLPIEDSDSMLLKEDKSSNSPPPAKRYKCDQKDMVDVCVGTSVGTITEPDCLGPCEPGTSVTLEGIVWHETEGGVLVVNVTWRGKTYVGTLIDCTKHDWAPPRFCDSPTEEFDSRTPKGRAKRGRSSGLFPVNDLSNFTETRSSMHSKLRNGGTKGRGGRGTATTAESSSSKTTTTSTTTTANSSSGTSTSVSSNTPSTSPVAFLPPRPEKRKSKDEPSSPVSGGNGNSSNTSGSVINSSSVNNTNASGIVNNGTSGTQSVVNPMTGLNVQISTKKSKSTASPCAISPVLLECPEQDCSKKYKHANGLRYHQSHAHGSVSSMDEDSSHPPESPQRVAPPTTPSPLPTVQSATLPAASTSPTTSLSLNVPTSTVTIPTNTSQVATSVAVTQSTSQNSTTPTTTTSNSSSQSSSTNVVSSPSLLIAVNVSTTTSTTTTPLPLSSTASQPKSSSTQVSLQSTTASPVTAGGSITTGVAGQSQQHSVIGTNSNLLSTALASNHNTAGSSTQLPLQTQPEQVQSQQLHQSGQVPQVNTNTLTATPSRCDSSTKAKSGVLRFGTLPGENEHNARLTTGGNVNVSGTSGPLLHSGQQQNSSMRPTNVGAGSIMTMQPTITAAPDGLNVRSQSCAKQKKSRKSPGPADYDVTSASRAEDVQSPAYSDISDDSTPVVDPAELEKSKSTQLPDTATKKPNEGVPAQLGPLPGYGLYPYYPGMPHQPPYYPNEHTGKPGHSPLGSNPTVDYKSKEPPLDLMNKPNQHQQQSPLQTSQSMHPQQLQPTDPPTPGNKDGPVGPSTHPGAGKMMQHFYPYGYMAGGFSYNLDSAYGPVSMISDDNKLAQQTPSVQVKDERLKESPSPNEYAKMGPQMVPTKLIKSEPITVKDMKTESGQTLHPKDQQPPGQHQGQPSMSAYSGMFQRQSLNVGPPAQLTQHINREEDLRRLFNYADQRRPGNTNNSSTANMSTKDEPVSPSQPLTAHNNQHTGHSQSSQNLSTATQQSQQQQQQKPSKNTPTQQQIKQQKEIKTEDKELMKVKQEGQKPTMETQGPPPPPTSQYYPHSLYMSAAPFGFDPNHQMYRNMLVPTASYTAPPYLPISRYTSPEDLSRNPSTKALDLLQHHASQYYNSHKIHELREGALKSPTSNVKVSVSSPNLSQQPSQNPNMCIPPPSSNIGGSGLPLQQQQQQSQPSSHQQPQPPTSSLQSATTGGPNTGTGQGGTGSTGSELQKDPGPPGILGQGPPPPGAPTQAGQPPTGARSPPPQRHVHTHHHTHVGLGYPMFQAPYGAVLASQQAAAAVTVISPFQTGPPAK